MDKLVDSPMQPDQDTDDFFMEKTLARAELEKIGDPLSDRRFQDMCLQGFISEYMDIKLVMYRDPTFDVDQMQSTMRHIFIDDLCRCNDEKEYIYIFYYPPADW